MIKLERHYVEKTWGRTSLPPMFDARSGKRIGEVWFTEGKNAALLAKYIFTGERLSIQVHPNDEQARARGLPGGKDECWYILDAVEGATLGLGLTRSVSKRELRDAALGGSIEQLVQWKPVRAGEFVFVPAGTIHAIGAGISLLEFQDNCDVTYRLYDYGRPRELHVDDAIEVAVRGPFAGTLANMSNEPEQVLVETPHFTLLHTRHDLLTDRSRWVIPLAGQVSSGDVVAGAGECLLVHAGEAVESHGARLLIGASRRPS
ncbi:MAG TPA: class I mannose-6-phosphate isomerase [Sphingomicrobium sp.]|nr:class I mannose-6-phosphate isomerase [Sphingomicrobium sp.]